MFLNREIHFWFDGMGYISCFLITFRSFNWVLENVRNRAECLIGTVGRKSWPVPAPVLEVTTLRMCILFLCKFSYKLVVNPLQLLIYSTVSLDSYSKSRFKTAMSLRGDARRAFWFLYGQKVTSAEGLFWASPALPFACFPCTHLGPICFCTSLPISIDRHHNQISITPSVPFLITTFLFRNTSENNNLISFKFLDSTQWHT